MDFYHGFIAVLSIFGENKLLTWRTQGQGRQVGQMGMH